jgi:hypothetical protein
MHPTALIAEDHGLAAAAVQCSVVDGLLSALMVPLTFLALLDVVGSWFGLGPIYLTTANTGKSKLALLSVPDVPEGWTRVIPENNSPFLNRITARGLLSILGVSRGRDI